MRLLESNLSLSAQILKVPHHGSNTSSSHDFISTVFPTDVIFSVGLNNIYNFPNAEVVESYTNLGCNLYYTDKNGAIIVTSDGYSYKIKTYN